MKVEANRIMPPGFGRQQTDAINWLSKFMASDKLEAGLFGYAGTGKTYLLKYFINHVCNVPVCPTAPTHKAVRVIEKVLNRKGKTLQSLHGLRPNLDLANFNISNPQFDPRGQPYIGAYKLVIIDEASMISNDIYDLNLQRAKQYNVKILYVGDPAQLPAINETNKTSKVFNVTNSFSLTEIMRQEAGNPLLELFTPLRGDVENNTQDFIKYLFANRHNIIGDTGYSLLNRAKFNNELFKEFSLEFEQHDLTRNRLLAYTNDRVKYYNNLIRNHILSDTSEILHRDDILTSYTTIVDEFNAPIITNSEDYVIDDIRPYTNQFEIDTFAVNLKSLYDGSITTTLQVVDHTKKSFKTYYQILNHLHRTAITAHKGERARKWIDYYKFKDSMLTMVPFKLSESNNNSTVKKDIDYGYAITVHKSQGSTFTNVFVDLQDIMYYVTNGKLRARSDKEIINRLTYVALSRAEKKVIINL